MVDTGSQKDVINLVTVFSVTRDDTGTQLRAIPMWLTSREFKVITKRLLTSPNTWRRDKKVLRFLNQWDLGEGGAGQITGLQVSLDWPLRPEENGLIKAFTVGALRNLRAWLSFLIG